jgi:PAS domain S-box-containing protein
MYSYRSHQFYAALFGQGGGTRFCAPSKVDMKERRFSVVVAAAAPEDRAAMRDALSRDSAIHYTVIEAESGLRALELRRARRPDCLILDHDLRDLSALAALKKLAAEEEAPACAVVVLVGGGEVRLAVEAMESGAHCCLEKNRAGGEELLRAVSHAIEKAERQRRGEGRERMMVGAARRVAKAAATGSGAGSRPERVDHKRAEEQLQLLKTAIGQSNEAIVITTAQLDPPGPQIVYINSAFTKMTGYSLEEVIGKTPRILQGPKTDRATLDRLRKDCEEGRVFFGEAINYRKDGSEFFIEWSVGPVRNERGEVTHFVATQRDVTERRRIEQALRRSEGEFRSLFELLTIGMAQVSRDYKFYRVNRKFCQMLGYSEQELLRLTFLDVTHPDDREISAAQASACFTGKMPQSHFEKRYLRKDGEVIWALINWAFIPDADGRPLRTVTSIQDITARKRAEEALRESESRLRQLADAMPQIVYTCGPDGIVDYVNQRWREYTGVSDGRDITETWAEIAHPDDVERACQKLRESVSAGRPLEVEYRLRRKDGQYRWHLARALPVRDRQGRIIKWIGTSTDIHDRKQAEAEREELLARAEAARAEAEQTAEKIRRLQSVTDSALAPLALDDLLREMLGHVRELLYADSATILLLADDGQSLIVRATIGKEDDALGLSIPVGRGVAGSIAASRAPVIVEDLSAVEVINPFLRRSARSLIGAPLIVEGRLIGVIHADTAQTRRFTEDDVRLLQLAADRIALAVEHARLYDVERRARRQAEEGNRFKDEFLAVVSHELRTPLNAMLGYATLLRRGGLDAQKVAQAAEIIERSGKAQAQLIDELLDTAGIISGKLRLEIGPVDLVSLIEETVQTIYPAANAKGISLLTDLPREVGQITGDPVRLRQVIWNLLSNAVKFTQQDGRVEVRLERIDPHISITVSDTGAGIRSDFLPYVFDRFRQADASSEREYGGLGLGLSLVKYLVELHGGTIDATSEGEGRGTTFKILLPVRAVATPVGEAEGAPVAVKDTEQDATLAGVRALVVDDQDDARELITVALSRYGADVIAASSAAEAYAVITAAPPQELPDVMAIDIGMPGENGYNLVRRLRLWERERGLHIPAVALTAYGRVEDRVRALNAGFQMHVTKPVEPDELAAVIASLFRRGQT